MSLQAKFDQPLCSCPSDGGSLRWPCLVHPADLDANGLNPAEREVLWVMGCFHSVSLVGLYDRRSGVKSADVQLAVASLKDRKVIEARNSQLGRIYQLTVAGRHLLKSLPTAVPTAAPGATA